MLIQFTVEALFVFVRDRNSNSCYFCLLLESSQTLLFFLCLLCTQRLSLHLHSSFLFLGMFALKRYFIMYNKGKNVLNVFSRLVAAESAEPRFMQEEEESSEEEEEELSPEKQG